MLRSHSFQYSDDALNRELIGLLKRAGIDHSLDEDGVIRYSSDEHEFVENELINAIRDRVFPSWQVLTCPEDWIARYRNYMNRRQIPFREEWNDGSLWFLIPRKYRPNSWKLDGPRWREPREMPPMLRGSRSTPQAQIAKRSQRDSRR